MEKIKILVGGIGQIGNEYITIYLERSEIDSIEYIFGRVVHNFPTLDGRVLITYFKSNITVNICIDLNIFF